MERALIFRILTGVVALPVLYLLIDAGGRWFTLWVALVSLIGGWEWWRLQARPAGGSGLLLILAGIGLLLAAVVGGQSGYALPAGAGLFLLLLVVGLVGEAHEAVDRPGRMVVGMLYLGVLPAFLVLMRALPHGREILILTYATVFICDTAAYGAGSWLGRRPLWRRVSPGKTWEGALAGLLAAVLSALGGALWFAAFLGPAAAIGFGLIVGTCGQVGDLVESRWKRIAGFKDSSMLIPGHGGVLDRFDNLHFVAPLLYLYLLLLG